MLGALHAVTPYVLSCSCNLTGDVTLRRPPQMAIKLDVLHQGAGPHSMLSSPLTAVARPPLSSLLL